MIYAYLTLAGVLLVLGYPIVKLLYPSGSLLFRVGVAPYTASLVIIVGIAIFYHFGVSINYSLLLTLGVSCIAWFFYLKRWIQIKKSPSIKEFSLGSIAFIGLVVFSGLVLFYLSKKDAFALFHMGPDYYGYGMSASFLQDGNSLAQLRSVFEQFTGTHNPYNPNVSVWSLGDLREAVSIDFIFRSNRYGVQGLAAVMDTFLLEGTSASKMFHPIMAMSNMALFGCVFEVLILAKCRPFLSVICAMFVFLNCNHLVAIFEGSIASVFSLAMPLLLCIFVSIPQISGSNDSKNNLFSWPLIVITVVLIVSSLIVYQEATQFLIAFISIVAIYFFFVDRIKFLGLCIGMLLSIIIVPYLFWNFIFSIYSRLQQGLAGGALHLGFIDFLGVLGLHQPYLIVPHTITPFQYQKTSFLYLTLACYGVFWGFTIFSAIKRNKIETISISILLSLFIVLITLFTIKSPNSYIAWKLSYTFSPILAIVLFQMIDLFDSKISSVSSASLPASIKKIIKAFVIIVPVSLLGIAAFHQFALFRSYISNSDFIYNEESIPFLSGQYSNKLLLSMSENQVYYLPGFHGGLYWLNSGWMPKFERKEMLEGSVHLVIFSTIEGRKFFDKCTNYFDKSVVFRNSKVIIVRLNDTGYSFLDSKNQTDRLHLFEYLRSLRTKIDSSQ